MKRLLVILSCFLIISCDSQQKNDKNLIGKWEGILKDSKNTNSIEKIVLEFRENGNFLQILGEGKSQNKIESTYEIQGNKLLAIENSTDEKSESRYFIENDTLTITYDGVENKYIKMKK